MSRLGVVVPTRGRSGVLHAMLVSLNEAVPVGARVPVAVVVDGTDDIDELLEGLTLDVTVLRTGLPRGPAYARNLGAAALDVDVFAFLDDDVIVPGGWVSDVGGVLEDRWDLVGGGIRSVRRDNLISQMFEALVIRHAQVDGRWYLSTANVLVRRPAFELLGGFDERFPDASGEDWDLCRRAHGLGLTVMTSPRFSVDHWNPSRLPELSSRARRYAASSPLRFASWRPRLDGQEEPLVRFVRRVRSPLRVLASPLTVLLPNFLGRYWEVRRHGFGRRRSAIILALHPPWFLTYSVASLLALRAAGGVDRDGVVAAGRRTVEGHS